MATKIPVRPTSQKKTPKPATKSNGLKKDTSKSSKTKAEDKVSAAEKRAVKRENEAKQKAGKRYLESAANLAQQAAAIRQALNVEFRGALDNNLADVGRALTSQLSMLQTGHAARAQGFLEAGTNTEKATGDTAERGFSNAVRERQDTLTAILEQGAGETDAMRAMLLSARNWQSNAAENNRAYFDTMQSVNAGITDLNTDTKGQMAGAFTSAEQERERLWQDFYSRRMEAFTQLGNTYGQQADYYAQAKEMGVKPKKGAEKDAEDAMKKAFADSAVEAGKSYTQEGVPTWITNFQGQEQLQARQSNTDLAAAVTMEKMAKAEGATLRKWDAA